eukprot:1043604-Rhodomonas_salina.1
MEATMRPMRKALSTGTMLHVTPHVGQSRDRMKRSCDSDTQRSCDSDSKQRSCDSDSKQRSCDLDGRHRSRDAHVSVSSA